MIKSVLQAIMSYVMSVYLLPEATIKEIERMMNSFWWGGEMQNKGIRWLAWDRMAYPKGLGVAKLYKARWTIGSGTNTKVMSDSWLRGKEGVWVQAPQDQGAYNITVNELMLPNVKVWDKVKIESIFPSDVVNRILDIPLFDMIEEDKLVWVDSAHGQYSVKSGYNLMINITGKMEDFVKKRIRIVFGKFMLHRRQNTFFGEFVKGASQHALDLKKGLFAMMIWVLWNNRNNRVWNESREEGPILGIKSRQNCQHDNPRTNQQQQQQLAWQKPPMDWYKCNVDAGFYTDLNKTSASWCLRDHTGSFVVAATSWYEGKCSITGGESAALLEAMKDMEKRGITHVIFETDSKIVEDAIHKRSGGNSEFSSLISNIKNKLLSNPNFVVKFIKRQVNMVAHTLARAAISWSSRCIFELLPICITSLLINEMI
ncbi:hypothetical protein TSUD_134030 [Trifolium subterraneum]|uniref:RNase H type-1 domain-containing protein n=1 Tax=Trifolium subterraneum TaxID=3900 RepID=A0A2Z6PEE3_TRISU|nr:hypothetical protein TSUD_134030 [Trifolium subterraneum]